MTPAGEVAIQEAAIQETAARLGPKARRDVPLGPLTTSRVGGPAALLARVGDDADLDAVAAVVAATGIATLVVGRGSNLLVSDRGYAGLVLVLGGDFEAVDLAAARPVVRAGGAVALPALARRSAAAGLTGFAWAVGVPGSVGGAVRMNAGGHGSDMAATLVDAEVIEMGGGGRRTVAAGELGLGYRTSAVSPAMVVLAVRLALAEGDAATAQAEIDGIVRWRREHQPGGQNSGSVFTNPEGMSAGQLLDAAGGRGLRIGTARISEKHANFIQVDTAGRAADVLALIRAARRLVHDHGGVTLHPELRLVGFDDAEMVGVIGELR